MSVKVSMVDTTQRIEWELTKEKYDSYGYGNYITSSEYGKGIESPWFLVNIGTTESTWTFGIFPEVLKEDNRSKVFVGLVGHSADVPYTVQWGVTVKTQAGHWPNDLVEDLYANKGNMPFSWKEVIGENEINSRRSIVKLGYVSLGSSENFNQKFVQNKITLVATVVIYVEGKSYLHHKTMARKFVDNLRSITDLDMLSDFTIICGDRRFKCHKNILASMSKVFKAMLVNEMFMEKNESFVNIDDASPEIVEAMLQFMSNGVFPKEIDEKAFELISVADKYDLEDLTQACEASLVNNITVENVIETLIIIDRCVPKSENRKKIIDFIKSEATNVVKLNDWLKFVQNYPNIVTEIFLAATAPAKASH